MSWPVYTAVVDEVARHPHAWLRLHARGEPLMHPQFVDMVAYAKQSGVGVVQAFTNAVALNEGKAVAIMEAGLDTLECSIHGHDQTYEPLMRNGKYEQVKRNVIRFRKLRDQLGARTRLVVSAVDQPLLAPERAAHEEFWSQYADSVIYRPYHSWGNRIAGACGSMPEARHPCRQLWTRCTIGPSGNIIACFNSWTEKEEEVLGNVLDPDVTIGAIWKSARYGGIRSDHANGEYSLPCCATCTDWTGSSWGDNSYEHLLSSKLGLREV
ncbi:MAG: SPASM domain-containing protein [Propionibacteriaceae bacterium]|jgi:MoaA/NifB/PqqE/SkfB family radical SAM enzyme|nr:SPASM domain-containing protein [Propionibacteriaceae bacterium]